MTLQATAIFRYSMGHSRMNLKSPEQFGRIFFLFPCFALVGRVPFGARLVSGLLQALSGERKLLVAL